MVSISGIAGSMVNMLSGLVPMGVDPIYFWLTLVVTFAITFLLLLLVPLFQNHRGSAFVVAGVISYFVASSAFATIIIAKLFPNIGLALMAILGLLMVVALLSPNSLNSTSSYTTIVILIAIAFVIWMTYSSVAPQLQAAGFISPSMGTSISNNDAATIIAAVIVIGVIWVLVHPKGQAISSLGDILSKLKIKK